MRGDEKHGKVAQQVDDVLIVLVAADARDGHGADLRVREEEEENSLLEEGEEVAKERVVRVGVEIGRGDGGKGEERGNEWREQQVENVIVVWA